MEIVLLLADWAESINGKLYIQGAGWSRVPASQPLQCALAIKISVPWDQANEKHKIIIRLVDSDGHLVEVDSGRPIVIASQFEVGRPPGLLPGSDIDATLAVKLVGLPLPKGRYRFTVELDEEPMPTGASFEVV